MAKKRPAYLMRELANILTLSRIFFAAGVFAAGANHAWALSFWLFALALVTDFFDGIAARKFNHYSVFGSQLDRIADFLLAVAALASLIFYADFPVWIGIGLLPFALVFGSIKVFLPAKNKTRLFVSMFSSPLLFLVWIFSFLGVADQAFGWTGWYLVLTFVIFLGASIIKHERYREWFAWLRLHKNSRK